MDSLVDVYENLLVPIDQELEKQAAVLVKQAEEEEFAGRIMARGFSDELEKLAVNPRREASARDRERAARRLAAGGDRSITAGRAKIRRQAAAGRGIRAATPEEQDARMSLPGGGRASRPLGVTNEEARRRQSLPGQGGGAVAGTTKRERQQRQSIKPTGPGMLARQGGPFRADATRPEGPGMLARAGGQGGGRAGAGFRADRTPGPRPKAQAGVPPMLARAPTPKGLSPQTQSPGGGVGAAAMKAAPKPARRRRVSLDKNYQRNVAAPGRKPQSLGSAGDIAGGGLGALARRGVPAMKGPEGARMGRLTPLPKTKAPAKQRSQSLASLGVKMPGMG